MSLRELAQVYYNEKGKNCAEALLLGASDTFNLGLKDEDAKLLVGFGGGMGCGSVCGCLAASISILGKVYYGNPKLREICGDFAKQFQEELKCDSIDCSKISAKYKTPQRRCEEAVLISADLLEKFITNLK